MASVVIYIGPAQELKKLQDMGWRVSASNGAAHLGKGVWMFRLVRGDEGEAMLEAIPEELLGSEQR